MNKGQSIRKQSGIALIIMMFGLVLFIATVLLTGIDPTSRHLKKQDKTISSLALAKSALIGYANINELKLPCPDFDGNGESDGAETGVDESCVDNDENMQGWFPWKTLALPVLRDGDGVCLRYAVSGDYKVKAPVPLPKGELTIKGADENDITSVAVVFAAGHVLEVKKDKKKYKQNRASPPKTPATECGSEDKDAKINKVENYLETYKSVNNANKDIKEFIHAPKQEKSGSTPAFNDVLIWIDQNEI